MILFGMYFLSYYFSFIMDDTGPQSLFVVVSYGDQVPYFSSILLFDTRSAPKDLCSSHPSEKEYVAHLSLPQGYPNTRWLFTLASSEDLCMVPDWGFRNEQPHSVQLQGGRFNLRTKKCKSIQAIGASRFYEHVVAVGGHIYVMAGARHNYVNESFWGLYNLLKESWETLDSSLVYGNIRATAVWDDTILLNMDLHGVYIIWAYNVGKNKWYKVNVDVVDGECYDIVGEAVVVGNTIYALTMKSLELVLALSIDKKEMNGDLVFKCSGLSRMVTGMPVTQIKDEFIISRHLVHLGKDNFCNLNSFINPYSSNSQTIQLAYIKLNKGENSMTVTHISVHRMKFMQNDDFRVELCFSLPDNKTTALKEGEGFVLEFNPFLEDYASKQKDKTGFNPEPEVVKLVQEFENVTWGEENVTQGEETVTRPDKEGHSIYVRKLPPNATVRQLENGLKKFGHIKRDGIQVWIQVGKNKNKNGKCFAYVEFESATSKQRAIEASTIKIGSYQTEILEKR